MDYFLGETNGAYLAELIKQQYGLRQAKTSYRDWLQPALSHPLPDKADLL